MSRKLEKLYTVDEAARILRVKRSTIYKYLWNGKIRAYKLGGKWRIPQSELRKLLVEKKS